MCLHRKQSKSSFDQFKMLNLFINLSKECITGTDFVWVCVCVFPQSLSELYLEPFTVSPQMTQILPHFLWEHTLILLSKLIQIFLLPKLYQTVAILETFWKLELVHNSKHV